MFFPAKKIICVAFTDMELSVAEFERSGTEPELISAGSVALQPGIVISGEIKESIKFIEALRGVLQKAQPSEITVKEVVVVVPEQQVYLTLLRFTETKSPGEILEEAPREALASIPLDYTQIYCDFYSLPKKKGYPNEVVYAACDKKVANEYIRVLSELNLRPVSFVIEPDAFLASSDNKSHGLKFLLVGNKEYSYWVISNGALIKKVVPSSLRISALPLNFKKMEAEVKTILLAYNSGENYIDKLSGISIWSDSQRAVTDDKAINEVAGAQAVYVSPKFPNETTLIQRTYGAAKKFFGRKYFGRGIDLLPVRFREQATLLQLNTFLTTLSIMLIFAAGGAMSVYSFAWSEMYFDFQRAEKEASGVAQNIVTPRFEEVKVRTRRFNEEVNALIKIQSKIIAYDLLWESISDALVSPGITSTSVDFDSDKLVFELLGAAKTRNDLRELQNNLKSLPEVSELISPLSNFDNTNDISYVLTLKLNPKKIPYLISDN